MCVSCPLTLNCLEWKLLIEEVITKISKLRKPLGKGAFLPFLGFWRVRNGDFLSDEFSDYDDDDNNNNNNGKDGKDNKNIYNLNKDNHNKDDQKN